MCDVDSAARTMGYQYVAFTTNNVRIPSGSLTILAKVLNDETVVMPVTTSRQGAGIGSAQVALFYQSMIYFIVLFDA